MPYSKEYHELNREIINQKRREKYDQIARKAYYEKTRDDVLLRGKMDRTICSLCKLSFRRSYLAKHCHKRHDIDVFETKS